MSFLRNSVLIACGLLCWASPSLGEPNQRAAHVNPNGFWYLYDTAQGWHFDVGLGIELEPTYAGSKENEVEISGLARAVYRSEAGHRYFITLGELGAIFSLSPDTQFVTFLEFEEGREADDDPALTGLDDIDSTLEGQFILAHRFNNWHVFATLQPDLTGKANKGLVWFVGAGYDTMLTPRLRAAWGLDLSGADSEYMQTEFGVNAAASARSGYAEYSPSAGLKSLTLNANLEYLITTNWSILASTELEQYLDKAIDSPLIKDVGSEQGVEANLLIRYRF